MGTTSLKRSKHAEVPCCPGCRGPRRGYVREGPVDLVQGLPREEVLREGEHPQVQHLECQQEDGGGTQRWGSRVDDGDVRVVFSDPQCQYGQLNHGVLAVGYDHGSNWIVKNSWGGSWGEGGYIRMKQGENSS